MSTSSEDSPPMDNYEDWTSEDMPMMDPDEEEEYQSKLALAVTTPPVQKDYDGPCHFLRLSRELRDMIYAELLLIPGEIDPYPPAFSRTLMDEDSDSDNDESGEPPIVSHNLTALFYVNQMISAEARETYYKKNTWRVPNQGSIDNPTIFTKFPNHFTHIVMPFHQLDLPGRIITRIMKREHTKIPLMVSNLDGARARTVHQWVLNEAGKLWRNAYVLLQWYMKNLKKLKTITIDLENFACPSGCCRSKLWRRAGTFHHTFLKFLRPRMLTTYVEKGRLMPKIYVRGFLNEAERRLVVEDLKLKEVPR